MRKPFWCWTAAGVLAAGGLFWAGHYAGLYPESCVGRCATVVSAVGAAFSPASTAIALAARALGMRQPEGGSQGAAPGTGAGEECVPDDPVPVVEAAKPAEAPPAEAEPVPDHPVAGVVEAPPASAPVVPAPGSAPVVLPEEEPEALPPAGGGQGAVAGASVEVPVASAEAADLGVIVPGTCPMTMPYCTDEGVTAKPMPYAEDGAGPAGPHDVGRATPCAKDPVPTPACKEDSHYHEHYSGCPYTGCPHPPEPRTTDPACKPAAPAASGKEEECEEPVCPRAKHDKRRPGKVSEGDGEECPSHPEVDTMEFRPSDAHLYDYGANGPL